MERDNWKLPPGRLIRISQGNLDYWKERRYSHSLTNKYPVCDSPILDNELPDRIVARANELIASNGVLKSRVRFRDVTGAQWIAIREFVFERDGYQCVYCGEVAEHADHLIPVTKFGSWHPDNVVAACGSCNCSKGNYLLAEWAGPKNA